MDSCAHKRFVDADSSFQQSYGSAVRKEEGGGADVHITPSSPSPHPRSRAATSSSQGRVTLPSSESVRFELAGDTEFESSHHRSSCVAFSTTHSQVDLEKEKPESSPQTSRQDSLTHSISQYSKESRAEELQPEQTGSYRIETKNYLTQQGLTFKPNNPFHQKLISVYASYPLEIAEWKQSPHKQTISVQTSDVGKQTASQNTYVVLDGLNKKVTSGPKGHKSDTVYLKLEPGCDRLTPTSIFHDKYKTENPHRDTHIGALNSTLPKPSHHSPSSTAIEMSNFSGMDIFNPVSTSTLSRTQERAELKELNDRFAAYVQYVRQLAERNNQVDSTAIIKSTKSLEVEIHNLKNMYEHELDKLRKEVESCNLEKSTHQVQANKQLQYSAELQDRLNVEMDKNSKLQDEMNNYMRKIGNLEAEIQDLRIAATRPRSDLEQLQRNNDNLTRELETWKHRYEHEQIARQDAENKIQQLMQKSDFSEKVNVERVAELNSRIDASAATILSLEAKVRDLSKTDVSVSELLKQVRDTAEAELRKFQIETEEQYNRNLTALKAQLDNDAKAVERLEMERTQLRGSVGELQAKIRNLEGQVANLDHQKQTLEDAIAVERNRAADSARSLERKLREVQDMLVVKMREVTTAREHNIPLKAEIEALKALLEEEEKRLRVPLGMTSSGGIASAAAPLSLVSSYNIATTATAPAAASTSLTLTSQPPLSTTFTPQPTTFTAASVAPNAAAHNVVSFTSDTRPYVPSPPLSMTYIPDVLQSPGPNAYDTMFSMPPYEGEMDPQMYAFTSTTPLAKYSYETSPGLTRLAVEPSPPTTPCPSGAARAKSAPEQSPREFETSEELAERQRNQALVSSDLGQGHDYFDRMFHDLQRDTLHGRPKSTPMRTDRPLSALYHDYTVSTSSATGDMKIFEVHQDGKYVRLLNDGVQEIEFGGYMLQQNVGGSPVAVYRFPPRTKFAPNSTITVYAGCNDHKLHNPPQDFVWKEQQKWGTGPECTTILCRPNGQAVAWTTAAHRFTRDAFQDGQSEPDEDATRAGEEKQLNDFADDESLTEISMNVNEPKPDPVYLRREKQQPPCLQANKHPHGNTTNVQVHPHTGQPRPLRYGNDNSSNNRQSRSQSSRPDPVVGQPYAGAAAQKMGSAPLRKFVSGVSTQPTSGIRASGKSAGRAVYGPPSPFHSPLQQELQQIYRLSGSSAGSSRQEPVVRFTA